MVNYQRLWEQSYAKPKPSAIQQIKDDNLWTQPLRKHSLSPTPSYTEKLKATRQQPYVAPSNYQVQPFSGVTNQASKLSTNGFTRENPYVAASSPVLKYGSRGDDVKRLQRSLGITADGIYGPQTQAAVRRFQQQNGLSADGIVGKNTWGKIGGGSTSTSPLAPSSTQNVPARDVQDAPASRLAPSSPTNAAPGPGPGQEQINLDAFKTEEATIEDLKRKYGFDYSREYAERVAETEAQSKRDAIEAQRQRLAQQTDSAKTDLEHDFFQRFLAQQQDLTNTGLNAGLAMDRNIRLDMNRQNALGDVLGEQALQNSELEQQWSSVNAEQRARTEQLYNERLGQAFDQLNTINSQRRDDARYRLDLSQRQKEHDEEMAWRKYQYDNMSASEKARLSQDIEQFGMDQAWKRYQFDRGLEFEAGYNENFNGGAGSTGSLGSLSQKYESGSRGPGVIANNGGDWGGWSYGTYQIATNTGTMSSFLKTLGGTPFAGLANLKPGSRDFNATWRAFATQQPEKFQAAQHNFIKQSHYDPARSRIENGLRMNLSQYPRAVHDALWSTAVQHGSAGAFKVWKNAGIKPGMSPEEVIRRVYRERGANNGMKYFSRSSASIRKSVVNRFYDEMEDALKMLG